MDRRGWKKREEALEGVLQALSIFQELGWGERHSGTVVRAVGWGELLEKRE